MKIGNIGANTPAGVQRSTELPSSPNSLDRAWNNFQREWSSTNKEMDSLVKKIPSSSRRLVELQLLSQQLHLRSLVAAKAGEALGSSVRRIQQMGGS